MVMKLTGDTVSGVHGGVRTDCSRALTAPLIEWCRLGPKRRMAIMGGIRFRRFPPDRMVSRMNHRSVDWFRFHAIAVPVVSCCFDRHSSSMATGPSLGSPSCSCYADFRLHVSRPRVLYPGTPGVQIPVTGAGYRALGVRPLSVPGCARAAIGSGSHGLRGPYTGMDTRAIGIRSPIHPVCAKG